MSENSYTPNKSMVGTFIAAIMFLVVAFYSLFIPFGFIFGFFFAVLATVFTVFFLWKLSVAIFRFVWNLPSAIVARVRRWLLSRRVASAKVVRLPTRKA